MPQIDTDKLNKYADAVFNRCNYFNDYVLETIGGRIKATGRLSAYDSEALKNIADISGDMDAITKKLAEITQLNIRDIEAIYAQVITEGTVSYKPLYDFKNLPFVPFEQNGFAKNLVRHWAAETAETMINLSRTKALCFDKYDLHGALAGSVSLAGAYQKAIDDAVIAISAGTVDFNTAMRGTIKQLGGSGVKVNYGGGVTRSLAGMVRQNLLYGAKQAAQSYDEYVGSELGCNGFEVDYHPHPRPSHEVIGGEMFAYGPNDITIDGIMYTSAEKDLEGNGSAESLLNDYGCLHFKYSVILGVSEPRYASQWLAEQKRKDKELIEFNGVKKAKYEWQQAARRLERGIRQERDTAYMARASGDKTLENKCSEKISAYRKTYDDLCGKTGLPRRYDRFAAYYPQNVDNGGESGIIKAAGKKPEVQDIHSVGKIDVNIYKCVTEDIKTDEVIITDERIQHIKDRHPNDYEKYFSYIPEIIHNPDYLIEANKADTAVVLKEIEFEKEKFKIILKISTKSDPENYKNSIISFWKVGETTWKKTIKNKKILYKKE